jgi:tetratricopeptide (TPR) repeat protein
VDIIGELFPNISLNSQRKTRCWIALGVFLTLLWSSCATAPERPETPEESFVEGLEDTPYEGISFYMSLGDPEAAIEAYEEARIRDPEDPDTLVLLAALQLTAGLVDDAESTLEDTLAEHPDHAVSLYYLALIRGAEDDREAQEDLLQQAVESDPSFASAYAALGELYLTDRRLNEAREAFEEGLDQDPENLVALVGLGNVLIRQEEYEEAEEVLTDAIEEAPEYDFAYVDRSRARVLQREFEEAEADLDEAIRLEPDFSWHYLDRGRVRAERRQYRAALEDFTRAIELNPEIFLTYVYRGRANMALENFEAAFEDYETALAMRPDYRDGFATHGALAFIAQEWEASYQSFQRAFEVEPDQYGYPLLAAVGMWRSDDEAAMRSYLADIAPSLPRDTLYWDMARFLQSPTGDGALLNKINREQDEIIKAQMLFVMGCHYRRIGLHDTAQTLFSEVEQIGRRGLIETRLATEELERYGTSP